MRPRDTDAQNGEPAAVVLTPAELDDLRHRELVRAKVAAGLASAKNEPTLSSSEVRKRVRALTRQPR